jgi:hypothetical protein
LELFSKAEEFLKPYRKIFMPESEVRALIQKTGVKTFPRPAGIPENFRVCVSDNGAGIVYFHPEHTHTSIRIMPGKLHSPNPYQQKPYVIYKKDGKTFDKFGGVLKSSDDLSAHIPLEEFVFRE